MARAGSRRPRHFKGCPVEIVRRGRRTYGALVTLPSGSRLYVAYRRLFEIYASGEPSISAAVRAGTAGWAIDLATLLVMRSKGVTAIAVDVTDVGDLYVAPIAAYFDPGAYRTINYTGKGRGGTLQRVAPLTAFVRRRAAAKV